MFHCIVYSFAVFWLLQHFMWCIFMKVAAAACCDDRPVTDRDISNAYCSIAEIYLTDCW